MIEALKKLIIKHGGTYDRYDNTELELLRRLCDALNLPYDKYMDVSQLFNLVADNGVLPEGGESGGSSESVPTWEDTLPNNLLLNGFGSVFIASNGIDAYSSSGSNLMDPAGIYYTNLQTSECKLISETGRALRGFEDSQGNIYISSYSGPFMCCNKDQCTILVQNSTTQFIFETSKGIYAAPTDNKDNGLYYITPTSVKKIIYEGYLWKNYIEADEKLYITNTHAGTGHTGIYILDGPSATKIYDYGQYWFPYYRDSNGNLYAIAQETWPNNSKSCIVCLDNGSASEILITPTGYVNTVYVWNGDLYLGCSKEGIYWIHDKAYDLVIPKSYSRYITTDNYFYGISKGYIGVYDRNSYTEVENSNIYYDFSYNAYKVYGDTVLMYYTGGSYSQHSPMIFNNTNYAIISELKSDLNIFEFGDYIYLSSTSSSYPGLFYVNLKDISYTTTISTGYNFYTYITSNNDIYVSSKSTSIGIYKVNKDTSTQVYNTSYYFSFYEDSIGTIYATSGNLNGILTIIEGSAVFTSCTYMKYLCNIDDNFYFAPQDKSGNFQHAYRGTITALMSTKDRTTNYYIDGTSVYTMQYYYYGSGTYYTDIYRLEGSTYTYCIHIAQNIPYFFKVNEQVYACSSETPTKDACVIELHDNETSKVYKYLSIN